MDNERRKENKNWKINIYADKNEQQIRMEK